jgi:hypothetical protein
MVTPVINALPAAPNRGDAPADFSSKADTFVAALPPFSIQVNTAVSWMADTMAATLDYKNAAAASANLASLAAQTAATQAALAASGGAAQVSLATTQAQNAAQSATNAQTYAAAAGSAAGIPTFTGHDAFDVLQINAAKTGVQWGKAGQSVGDILVTARAPGTTYALAGRVSYLQSAYPDLYSLLGAIADTDRSTLTTAALNPSFPSDNIQSIASSDVGNLIIATVAGQLFCHTSTDGGVTWVRRAAPFSTSINIECLNGVFVVGVTGSSSVVYRTTDGITWTTQTLAAAQNGARISTIAGLFVAWNPNTPSQSTSPDGITWTGRAGFGANLNVFVRAGAYLFALSGSTTSYYTSDGITWNNIIFRDIASSILGISSIKYTGGAYYAACNGSSYLYKTSTPVALSSWVPIPNVFVDATGTAHNSFTVGDFGGVGINGADCVIFTTTSDGYWVGTESMTQITYKVSTQALSLKFVPLADKFVAAGLGTVMASLPYRSYDKATNFITPRAPNQTLPLQTYVKGKLV